MKQSLPNPAPQILNTDTKLNRYWNLRSIVEAASTSVVAEMMGVQTPRITSIAGPNPVRAIGDVMAASIEKTFSLKPGTIDATPDRHVSNDDPTIAEVTNVDRPVAVALDAVQFATVRTQASNGGRLRFDVVFRLRFLLVQLP